MGTFYGFKQVLPYGLGEKNWREQFWAFFLYMDLSINCFILFVQQKLIVWHRSYGSSEKVPITWRFFLRRIYG